MIRVNVKTGTFKIGDMELTKETTLKEIRQSHDIQVFLNDTDICCCETEDIVTDGYLLSYLFFNVKSGKTDGFFITPYNPDNSILIPTSEFIRNTFGDPHIVEPAGYYYSYNWGSISIIFGDKLKETERPVILVKFKNN